MAYKSTREYDPLKEPVMIPISEVGLIAEAHGAPVWGAAAIDNLPGDREEIEGILPGARTVVVLGSPHSRSAIASTNIQVAQYLSLIHISEPTRLGMISYAVF